MNSPPDPGSPSLSTPFPSSPPGEYFPQEDACITDLLNMVTSGFNSSSSSKRPPSGDPSTGDSKSRRREGPYRAGSRAATWETDSGSSSRKKYVIDNSAVDFLRKEIGDPFLE